MSLLEKQLIVKKSTIQGSGRGLFTKKDIVKGTTIVEYKGKRTSWKEVNHDDGYNVYIYYINRQNVIDGNNYTKSFARYANDAKGLTRVPGLNNNSRYILVGKRVYIEATRDIAAGSEILVSYGSDYWKVIRKNFGIR